MRRTMTIALLFAVPGPVLAQAAGDDAMSCEAIDAEGARLNAEMERIQQDGRNITVSDAPAEAAAAAGQGLMLLESLGGAIGIVPGAAVSAANIAAAKAAGRAMHAEGDAKAAAVEARLDAALDRMDRLGALYAARCR